MVNENVLKAEENLLHIYNRFPLTLDHGDGVYLYDTDGKKYLDLSLIHIQMCIRDRATGYAGGELVRILTAHKETEIVWYGSRSYIDQKLSLIHIYFMQLSRCKEMFFDFGF